MGAGFHGRSGIKQTIKADIWRKYVVPRLTYGLEVLTLKKKDLNSLESFQVRCAKQLQGLPTKTSNSAATALLGYSLWKPVSTNVFCHCSVTSS